MTAEKTRADASVLHLPSERYPGRRVLFAEAEITDPDGTLIAKASGTEIPADVPS